MHTPNGKMIVKQFCHNNTTNNNNSNNSNSNNNNNNNKKKKKKKLVPKTAFGFCILENCPAGQMQFMHHQLLIRILLNCFLGVMFFVPKVIFFRIQQ